MSRADRMFLYKVVALAVLVLAGAAVAVVRCTAPPARGEPAAVSLDCAALTGAAGSAIYPEVVVAGTRSPEPYRAVCDLRAVGSDTEAPALTVEVRRYADAEAAAEAAGEPAGEPCAGAVAGPSGCVVDAAASARPGSAGAVAHIVLADGDRVVRFTAELPPEAYARAARLAGDASAPTGDASPTGGPAASPGADRDVAAFVLADLRGYAGTAAALTR